MSDLYLLFFICILLILRRPVSTLFPYTTLFRSAVGQIYFSHRSAHGVDHPAHSRTFGVRQFGALDRSEEHTSELQSRPHLVCRLLLEKKNLPVTPLFHFFVPCIPQ